MKYLMLGLLLAVLLGVPHATLHAAQGAKTQTVVLPRFAQFQLPQGFQPLVQGGADSLGTPSYLADYSPSGSGVARVVLEVDRLGRVTLRERNSTAFQRLEQPSGGERLIKETDTNFAGSDCSAYLFNASSTGSARVEYRLLVNHLPDQDFVVIHIWATSRNGDIAPAEEAAKRLASEMSRSWRWALNPF